LGEVTGGVVEPPASERYKADPDAQYEQPLASPDNPLPIYPPHLLSKRLPPISMQIRVVVDDMGQVTSVIAPEQTDAGQLPFVESIRSTVQGWKFTQLIKIIPGPGSTTLFDAMGNRSEYPGKAIALPFHQDYRFVFSQSEGKANITVHPSSSPES